MANQELDASVINPSREVEESEVNLMKEEMYKLKQQMAEMYQAWAKGQPPPAYPTNPAFIPPLAQSQDHPATYSSSSFPIYQHYQSTTSQTPPAPPPKPVPYPPPPATPVFVVPLPLHSTDPPASLCSPLMIISITPRSPLSKLQNPIPTRLILISLWRLRNHQKSQIGGDIQES
uniref:Leucine-rich repeat extensin-like protein 2 n=1 Tax=Nicotiana sylvestris TaxID=4096 RepID=A0A1U7W090_NICSY|nr:PREDICTED: leucine-rich repeat extensin-like protein 2 [Nicotiana sylvestris]